MIKEHNKSKRRRKQKEFLRVIRNPEHREEIIRTLIAHDTQENH